MPASPPIPRRAPPAISAATQWSLGLVVALLVFLNVIVVLKIVSTELSESSAPGAPKRIVVKPPPVTSVTFVDAEQRIQMTATSAWGEAPISTPGAILSFQDPARDVGVIVLAVERKALERTYNDLDAYDKAARDAIQGDLEGATQSTPIRLAIGGNHAIQTRIAGIKGELAITIVHTVVETPDRFFEIRGVCASEHFRDYESQLLEVIASTRFAPFADAHK